jgi:hypothetical protein
MMGPRHMVASDAAVIVSFYIVVTVIGTGPV